MSIINQIQLLDRLHELIKRKATGTPAELASKLKSSTASVYRYINELKSFGAEVKYSKEKQSYIYEKEFKFEVFS